MVGKRANKIAACLVLVGTLGVPAIGSAQSYRYGYGDRRYDDRHVSVRCAPARRGIYARSEYDTYRPVVRRSRYYEHRPRRSAAKSTLMIAGSAATGAGIGGALRGKRGALIGAAIGGGSASIYEAAKRRR
jgi:hypothetical protein